VADCGLQQVLSLGLTGVQVKRITLDAMTTTLSTAAVKLEDVLASRPSIFSWQKMVRGESSRPDDLRRYIQIRPVFDYASLEPGEQATQAIGQAAADFKLDKQPWLNRGRASSRDPDVLDAIHSTSIIKQQK
jgi:hypothetical protein